MKKCFIIMIMAVLMGDIAISAHNGNSELSLEYGMDISSSYIWRGYKITGASLQPEISLSLAGNGFDIAFGLWGNVDFESDIKELETFLSASTGGFSLLLTDYTTPKSYFCNYSDNHALDMELSYSFGDILPLTLTWSSIVAGEDKNSEGKQCFSSYFEVNYDFSLAGLECWATVGCLPFSSPYYTDTEGFVLSNISLGAIRSFSFWNIENLPVGLAFTYNLDIKNLYCSFFVSF